MPHSKIPKSLTRSLFPLGALLFIIIVLAPAGSRAQQYPSARIESLGGDAVSGIIPDTLTDIYLNPAYLYRCPRLTINYGQRRTGTFQIRFPRILVRRLVRNNINSYDVTELTLLGITAGSWKIGLSAGWYLDYRDDATPGSNIYIYTNNISEDYSIDSHHEDNHDYRVDLSISREISPATAIGFRVGGFHRTYIYEHANQRQRYEFNIDEYGYEDLIKYEGYSYRKNDNHKRANSLFLQAGLLTDSGGKERSILFRITRNEIYSKYRNKDLSTATNYDQFGGADSYVYRDEHARDERKGVLWAYDIRGRFSLQNGFRIFAGGGFEHMNYETSWMDSYLRYEWEDDWMVHESEKRTSLLFDGEEEYRGFNVFLKAGRTTELREDLKLTAGIHSYMRWSRAKEDPVSLITLYSRVDSAYITLPVERKLGISTETINAVFSVPLAIEYEPARWISIWSGFRIYANYTREKDRLPNISAVDVINFLDPSTIVSYFDDIGVKTVDDIILSSTATFGLSLRYRNRFFVDVHTGYDVTPDYITSYILDVRYAF